MHRPLLARLGLAIPFLLVCSAAHAQLENPQTTRSRDVNAPSTPLQLSVRLSTGGQGAVPSNVRVILVDDRTDSDVDSQTASHSGEVTFMLTMNGRYRIRVTGKEVEETTTPPFQVSLQAGRGGGTQYVQIQPKGHADDGGVGAGPMVSAAELNVPDKARKEFNKAQEAMADDEKESARKHLEKALEIYPKYALAHYDLGVLSINEGDKEAGRKQFEQAIEINDKFVAGYYGLARLAYGEKAYADVDRFLTKLLTFDPLNVDALLLLAKAEAMEGKLDDALSNVRKIHGQPHQRQARAHLLAAKILERRKKYPQAAQEYQAFLAESPNDVNAQPAKVALQAVLRQQQAPQN